MPFSIFGRRELRLALALAITAAVAAAVLLFAGPAGAGRGAPALVEDGPGARTAASRFEPLRHEELGATIRRTKYGIPHIVADDFAGLAYGYGYAFAEDNICTIAEAYVTVNAQRSRYFGPDGSWSFRANGSTANNLNSDFFYQRINDSGVIEELVVEPPPHGPKVEIKQGVRGYVAGYNEYLAETGVDSLPDPRCRGAEWVRPITSRDVYRRFYQLASLASAGVAIDGIGGAQPPGASDSPLPLLGAGPATGATAGGRSTEGMLEALGRRLPNGPHGAIGSNAYGIGGELTDNGRGLVLSNPHFPWFGSERLYHSQLTIPSKLNVQGGSLYGVPLVLVGSTDGLAWSHTVATAFRFTPFELTLAPGDPTAYVVDGEVKPMQADEVTVTVRNDDGSLAERSRTLYRTEHGPMITEILGLPLFPWTTARAYAMGDANERNFRYLNHFLDNNMAQSVQEYDAIQRRYQGIPWVNSVAADHVGATYYTMNGAVPNVPDSKVAACPTALGQAAFSILGLPVLDGSRSACNWDDDGDAAAPGIFGSANLPTLFRRDFVHNGNDSHWLTNPAQPLEGFARIVGDERTARTLRTRLGLVMVEDRVAGRDGHPGNGFSLPILQDLTLNNRQHAGELWRDALVALCESSPTLLGSSGPVDVSAACAPLAAWDLHDDLDSPGAILFRRFAARALAAPAGLPGSSGGTVPVVRAGGPFADPFDAGDPVHTPRGLNTSSPSVRQAFADAVTDLRGAGVPLDARLRDHQFADRGELIPIHGGPGSLGVFNAINTGWRAGEGVTRVEYGSSYIATMQFTAGSCPVEARTFVTYSQSENPESPHYNDQTKAFSRKAWHNFPYCEQEIRSRPELEVERLGNACTPRGGLRAASVRISGGRIKVGFSRGVRRSVGLAVLRVSDERNPRNPLRLVSVRRTRRVALRPVGSLPDGAYVVRLRIRAANGRVDERQFPFRVRRGAMRREPLFARADRCDPLERFELDSPVFGGRRRKPLRISYQLDRDAKVALTVKRGRRTVKRAVRRRARGARVYRVRVPGRVRRGRYRVTISARTVSGERVRASLNARRL